MTEIIGSYTSVIRRRCKLRTKLPGSLLKPSCQFFNSGITRLGSVPEANARITLANLWQKRAYCVKILTCAACFQPAAQLGPSMERGGKKVTGGREVIAYCFRRAECMQPWLSISTTSYQFPSCKAGLISSLSLNCCHKTQQTKFFKYRKQIFFKYKFSSFQLFLMLFIIIQLFLSLRIIIRWIRFSPEWNFLTWFRMKENSIRKQKAATSTFLPLLPLLLFIISLIIQSIPQVLINCCFLLPPNNTGKYSSRLIRHS